MLYARVFTQILDSSLAEDWQARHVFEDLLKLADSAGRVDMTRPALARRTNVPEDVIDHAITFLESPDPESRDPDHDGRRIARIDNHRAWGWVILNWQKYEAIRNVADQRISSAARKRKQRAHEKALSSPTPPSEQSSDVPSPSEGHSPSRASVTCHSPSHPDRDTREREVEFPVGFPANEDEARMHADFVGCTKEFAALVWNQCAGRGGTDWSGQPIKNFRAVLKARTENQRGANGQANSQRGKTIKADHTAKF